jgi:hypothetical protein
MKHRIVDLILGITRSQQTIRGVFNKNKFQKYNIDDIAIPWVCAAHLAQPEHTPLVSMGS